MPRRLVQEAGEVPDIVRDWADRQRRYVPERFSESDQAEVLDLIGD